MEPIQLAAVLAAVVLVASMASVELGVTVALIELTLGVVAGNVFELRSQEWLDFIAAFALNRPHLPRRDGGRHPLHARPARERRSASASPPSPAPVLVATLVCYLGLEWSGRASLIAGTALSTTSLAVVYAVLVERDLSDTRIGKLLMSATFVTDLCTALALSAIFLKPNVWFPAFLAVSLGSSCCCRGSRPGSSAATAAASSNPRSSSSSSACSS